MALLPVWPASPLATQSAPATVAFPRDLAYDLAAGDLRLDPSGRILVDDPLRTWQLAAVRAILTERGAYRAFSRRYGAALRRALRLTDEAAQQRAIAEAIRGAVLPPRGDGRTLQVRDLAFSRSGRQLSVQVTLVPAVGEPQPLQFALDWAG